MMSKPTEEAEYYFYQAQGIFSQAMLRETGATALSSEFAGHVNAMQGLAHLSVGLRATYLLLEEVRNLLQRQGGLPRP
jgi:hypothetical protein